jgi:uncharacterized membrane protein YfcA
MDLSWPLALVIGLLTGYLSGQFGIGGGIITTPALRLLLNAPELIAVATPLPVIIPTAATGAISYIRRGMADVRAGVTLGLLGSAFAVAGAFGATLVGGSVVLLMTAALIGYMAIDMALLAFRPERPEAERLARAERARSWVWLGCLGAVTGLYSGFLGLGGGFIIVPSLVRLFAFPVKRAVGTSLVAVTLLAIPGTITHYLLGNVDVGLALALTAGVVPGALLGAKVTAMAQEKTVRVGFAAVLLLTGLILGLSEVGVLR